MRKPFVILWLSVLVGLIFYWIYLPVLSKYHELKAQEQSLSRRIEFLDKQLRDLERERNLLKNDLTYLEKVIREELGLVKPGETIYKFVEAETQEDSE